MASVLTAAQLDALRRRLQGERARILRVLAPAPAPSEDAPAEFEESAQRETERSQAQGLVARERALLTEIDRALAKMEAGTYGTSEESGEPIPYERLKAVPWARVGVDE